VTPPILPLNFQRFGAEHVSLDYLASKKIRLGFTPDVLTGSLSSIDAPGMVYNRDLQRQVGQSVQRHDTTPHEDLQLRMYP
jgi:hypothetical protein